MWLLICSKCGYRIEQQDVMAGQCPSCGAASWLCHLLERDKQPVQDDYRAAATVAGGVATDQAEQPSQLSGHHSVTADRATDGRTAAETKCNKIRGRVRHSAGRPRAAVPAARALELKDRGMSLRDIAGELGISHMTVKRLLAEVKRGHA